MLKARLWQAGNGKIEGFHAKSDIREDKNGPRDGFFSAALLFDRSVSVASGVIDCRQQRGQRCGQRRRWGEAFPPAA